jgi:hypothetical protein
MMRRTVAFGLIAGLGFVSRLSAAIIASDDFQRTDNTNLGSTPVGAFTWTEYGGSDANTATDVASLVSGEMVVSAATTSGASHAQIGPFPSNNLSVAFDLSFDITGTNTALYQKAASIMIWRPDAADWGGSGGSARSAGVVDVRFYPNGLINLRTNDGTGSDYVQNIVFEENGSLSSDTTPHSPGVESATANQKRTINLTMIDSKLSVFVGGTEIIDDYAILVSPPATNYVSFGKDFITASSGKAFNPQYDNIVISEIPEPSAVAIIMVAALGGIGFAHSAVRRRYDACFTRRTSR